MRRVVAAVFGLAAGGAAYVAARGHAPTWYGPLLVGGAAALLATLMMLSLSRRASSFSREWAHTSRVFAQAEADHAAAVAARPDPRNTVQVNL